MHVHLQLRVRERGDNVAVRRIRPQPTAGDTGVVAEMPSFASGSLDPTVQSAFQNAPMGVAVTRLDGVIVACNPALGELIGTDPGALLGGALYDVIHPDDVDDARHHCATVLADELRVVRQECRFRRMDRHDIWVSISVSRAPATAGGVEHKVIHVENISERKKREAELSHQALHDPLTGWRTGRC